jgi:hypothetical protein
MSYVQITEQNIISFLKAASFIYTASLLTLSKSRSCLLAEAFEDIFPYAR